MYYNTLNKFFHLELRLCVAIVVAIIIVVVDGKSTMLLPLRKYVGNSIHLFYYLCNQSVDVFGSLTRFFIGYKKLIIENNILREELFLKRSDILLMDQYKQENDRLYALLNDPKCKSNRKLVAKILISNIDSCHQQSILNQGSCSDVYIGQPVITDLGIVGQVISVNKNDSRVLLISDRMHALPVKLRRNDIRMILMGRGYGLDLYSEYPNKIDDIYIDDLLVTSGLDGRFPEGYPVATVSEIQIDSEKDFTIIRARPIVDFQNLRYSILIWE